MGASAIVRALAGACVAALVALPAFADIKSFNAAVAAGDYGKAAAEAASTWATLDKSRKDIALIAREFGFVSYVAKEYAAAKTFAEFAAGQDAEGAEAKTVASVLLRAADYRLKPSDATRDALFGALEARAVLPNFDNISFAATEALIAHDIEKGRWKDAAGSTELGAKLAGAGGAYYSGERRKYELFGAVAEFMTSKKPAAMEQFTALRKALIDDISTAPSEAAAQKLVPLYWQVFAWREAVDAFLVTRGGRSQTKEEFGHKHDDPTGRLERLLDASDDAPGCMKKFDQRDKPVYPSSAIYSGMVGSVVLRVDLDEAGVVSNPEILAAVPDKYFGDAVLKSAKSMRYQPGEIWNKSACAMAEKGRIILFKFQIGR